VPNTHPAIVKMLEKYDLSTYESTYEALREILQKIVLLGLYRARFFEHAVFYGGTALRILHGLDRFSEDLDFSLTDVNPDFNLSHYEDAVIEALHSFGFEVSIQMKQKENDVKFAFVKGDTMQYLLNIKAPQNIIDSFGQGKLVKIKIEVDTNPPSEFQSEKITLLSPSPFMINTMTLSSLFAGKMHALLCRNWTNRPKGRDWYDFVWYITQGYSLDLQHLNARLQQNCPWKIKKDIPMKSNLTQNDIKEYLIKRINTLDIVAAKRDIEGFISDRRVLDIWSRDFFLSLIPSIKLV